MSKLSWSGPVLLVLGIVLGGTVAAGSYIVEARDRAQAVVDPVGPVARPAPVTLNAGPGDEGRGRQAYDHACSGCHGTLGRSDTPLHGPLLNVYYPDNGSLAGIVRSGIGSMPGTPASDLSDQDVADVIAYIRTFP